MRIDSSMIISCADVDEANSLLDWLRCQDPLPVRKKYFDGWSNEYRVSYNPVEGFWGAWIGMSSKPPTHTAAELLNPKPKYPDPRLAETDRRFAPLIVKGIETDNQKEHKAKEKELTYKKDKQMDSIKQTASTLYTHIKPYEKYILAAVVLYIIDYYVLEGKLQNKLISIATRVGNGCVDFIDKGVTKIFGPEIK